ncbi:MAG: hypothetical protein C0171_02910 [Caldisphaera sp.]|nr:MAG: hypothetical protein C0171_02910 [Caldisphaera sp.]
MITFAVGISLAIALKEPLYIYVIVALIVFALTYISSDAASKEMMNYVQEMIERVSGNDVENKIDIDMNDIKAIQSEGEEDLFLVYNLLSSIAKNINKDAKNIIMEIYNGDFAAIYPENSFIDDDDDISDELSYNYPDDGPKAEVLNNNLIIKIPGNDFINLVSALKRGEGETGVFSSISEVRSLYFATKAIAEALLGDDYEELISYSSYKAIILLKKKGFVSISENLMEELPFESRELKRKIKEQIKEENGQIP